MFLRLKYMPAKMINLRKTFSPVKYGLKNYQYVVLNIRDICSIVPTSLKQVSYLCFIVLFFN